MADQEPSVLTCSFKNESTLYSAFMPFIKNGGLFIRTDNILPLASEVQLSVTLMDDTEPHSIEGKVVWVTPKGAQDNKPPGVGVQFIGEKSQVVRNKIENYLAGMSKSSQNTDTI